MLRIARHEFLTLIRNRRFMGLALALPLLFVVSAAVPVLLELAQGPPAVGYVDQSGLLDGAQPADPEALEATLEAFPDEAAGRAALAAEQIDSLWLVPADYLDSGKLQVVVAGDYGKDERQSMETLLREALLRGIPADSAKRILEPSTLTFRSLAGGPRVRSGAELIFALGVPLSITLALPLATSFVAGTLASAVATEKENRMMEILVTSVRPWMLVGGKVLGLGAVSLVQVALWVGTALLFMVRLLMDEGMPSRLPIAWDVLGVSLLLGLLAFSFYAALIVGLGVVVPGTREAQQAASLVTLAAISPIWFIAALIEQPDGTLARVLSLVPFTSALVVPFRLTLGKIAPGEVLLAVALLLLALAATVWASARLFQQLMLHYGEPLSPRQLLAMLRG